MGNLISFGNASSSFSFANPLGVNNNDDFLKRAQKKQNHLKKKFIEEKNTKKKGEFGNAILLLENALRNGEWNETANLITTTDNTNYVKFNEKNWVYDNYTNILKNKNVQNKVENLKKKLVIRVNKNKVNIINKENL